VAALVGGQTFLWDDLGRNENFIQRMLDATHEFSEALKRGELPEATEGDHAALKLLYPNEEPDTVIELPEEAIKWADTLEEAKADKVVAEGGIKWAEEKLFKALKDNARGNLPDGRAYTWKTVNRKAHEVKASSSRQLRRVNK
jgi:predicted phage-related endonuclease